MSLAHDFRRLVNHPDPYVVLGHELPEVFQRSERYRMCRITYYTGFAVRSKRGTFIGVVDGKDLLPTGRKIRINRAIENGTDVPLLYVTPDAQAALAMIAKREASDAHYGVAA